MSTTIYTAGSPLAIAQEPKEDKMETEYPFERALVVVISSLIEALPESQHIDWKPMATRLARYGRSADGDGMLNTLNEELCALARTYAERRDQRSGEAAALQPFD